MIIDGVTLPDLPENVYPYSVIFWVRDIEADEIKYALVTSDSPFVHVKKELLGQQNVPFNVVFCNGTGYSALTAEPYTKWDSFGEGTKFHVVPVYDDAVVPSTALAEYVLIWTNHPVYEVATINTETGAYTVGGIYFPNSEAPKPTRVSIGRSLVDGYAKEVQRLTGTTDQMNAIQIREKLSTVKAAIKIGDVVLPAIPEDVLAEYPNAVIGTQTESDGSTSYVLGASVSEYIFVSAELNTTAGMDYLLGRGSPYAILYCGENGSEWIDTTAAVPYNTCPAPIVWSNHDVYTAVKSDNGYVAGTEVYFSERQNFNGVWLPKVPDDVLAQYPYMFVISVTGTDNDTYYFLHFANAEWFFGKSGLVGNAKDTVASFGTGGSYGCSGSSDSDWFGGSGDIITNPNAAVGDLGDRAQIVEWANQDIVEIVNIDMTTGAYTTGDLYFPPLPAIDTDRVSIGYDLCNGIVEEVQRLSGDQDKMDALHAYWKLTTVV